MEGMGGGERMGGGKGMGTGLLLKKNSNKFQKRICILNRQKEFDLTSSLHKWF